MLFIEKYLYKVEETIDLLDKEQINEAINILWNSKQNFRSRLFIIGLGGSLANAQHAVNDFRKLAGIESYTYENVSELTASINDDGWDNMFVDWLKRSRFGMFDCLLVLSVGGGNKKVSNNLIKVIDYAKELNAKIIGIVSELGGYTEQAADVCIIIPTVEKEMITPLTESFQSIILHLIVTHPKLKINKMKWE